ncbi:MAG TPA: hypothetical protein VFM18_12230 [Methanosarcina sp.]|nr:hypothetical protein [Methanosarcina sp.]
MATVDKLNQGNMLTGGNDEYLQNVTPTDKGFQDMGLAAQSRQVRPEVTPEEIMQMIMNGARPEELIQQGVPAELVQMAMEMINKQYTKVPADQAGLASTVIKPDKGLM